MIEQESSLDSLVRSRLNQAYLCLYGHFYQPPREEPFTNAIPVEYGATPYANFNEKITVECYRPNADAGNFEAISFDLGPTLAAWLEKNQPDVYQRIITSEQQHVQRYGVSNALAQAYNHTILPLATTRDKYTQILWGLQDYRHRYGHDAHGMWLAETAVDLETLDIMAQCGITYTVLAPWQAASSIDTTEPYKVCLRNGRSITVFFYNAPLSGGVSFDWNITNDANVFASYYLKEHLVPQKVEAGEDQLIVIATDGELYGHHKPWRDKFLSYLVQHGAPANGFEVCSLERYMLMHPAHQEVQIHVPSAWSCAHGVARWNTGCECTEGDSSWKGALRRALTNLAQQGDQVFEQYAGKVLSDPWAARNDYLSLRNNWEQPEVFWKRHCKRIDPCCTTQDCCWKRNTTNNIALRAVVSSSRIWTASSRVTILPSRVVPSASTGKRSASTCKATFYATLHKPEAGAQASPASISINSCRLSTRTFCHPWHS
jgi:alpha-amylase/alpha-mannosidase (GH57 family)